MSPAPSFAGVSFNTADKVLNTAWRANDKRAVLTFSRLAFTLYRFPPLHVFLQNLISSTMLAIHRTKLETVTVPNLVPRN